MTTMSDSYNGGSKVRRNIAEYLSECMVHLSGRGAPTRREEINGFKMIMYVKKIIKISKLKLKGEGNEMRF